MKMKLINTAIFVLITFAISCKKDISIVESKNHNLQAEIKKWVMEEISKKNKLSSLEDKSLKELVFSVDEINWRSVNYITEEAIAVTKIETENKKQNIYLVTEYVNEKITKGYIVCMLTKQDNAPVTFSPKFLHNDINLPKNFTGAIILYDLSGKTISSKGFVNGNKEEGRMDKILSRSQKQIAKTQSSNYAPLPGCYIIDHWWVTYDTETGEILEIVWIGETQVCPGTGGGGGNGGNGVPSNQAIADAAALSILNSMQVCSEILSIIETVPSGPLRRTKMYSWKCVKNPTWGVIAYDKGVHRKINGEWQWESLENLGISTTGFVTGGTVTATKVFATPTMGIYNSKMDITVNVASSVSIAGASTTRYQDFSSNITWNVNSQGMPGY